MNALLPFLWGATASACAIAALFFWRYWRISRDRLFVFFTVAFAMLALNWIALATIDRGGPEALHPAYGIRLGAFLLILVAIVDKNRRAR